MLCSSNGNKNEKWKQNTQKMNRRMRRISVCEGMDEENSIQIDSSVARERWMKCWFSSWNSRMSAVILSNSQPISLKNKAALILTAKNQSYNINWNDCKKSPKNHKISLFVVPFIHFAFFGGYNTDGKRSRLWKREGEIEREKRKIQQTLEWCLSSYLLVVVYYSLKAE